MLETARRVLVPGGAPFRWSVMVLSSLMIFGSYFAYDSVGAVAVDLKEELGLSGSQVGMLYSAYHVPNTVAPFFGGVLVDRIGVARAAILFNGFVVVGTALVASSPFFPVMLLGRLVFGIGAESLVVVQSTVVGEWFMGKEMALSMGLCLTFARLAYFVALTSLPRLSNYGYQVALWATAVICFGSLLMAAVLAILDSWGRSVLARARESEVVEEGTSMSESILPEVDPVEAKTIEEQLPDAAIEAAAPSPDEDALAKFWRQLTGYSASMWLVACISLTFYPSVQPFVSFGVDFLTSKYGYSKSKAGDVISIVSFTTMVGTPLVGAAMDRFGHMIALMAAGAGVLVACFVLLALTTLTPIPMVVGVGIGYSMIPAGIWPAIPRVVPEATEQATAFGIATAAYNIGLFVFPVVVGFLEDHTGSYTMSDLALAGLAALCCGVSAALWFTPQARVLTLPSERTVADA